MHGYTLYSPDGNQTWQWEIPILGWKKDGDFTLLLPGYTGLWSLDVKRLVLAKPPVFGGVESMSQESQVFHQNSPEASLKWIQIGKNIYETTWVGTSNKENTRMFFPHIFHPFPHACSLQISMGLGLGEQTSGTRLSPKFTLTLKKVNF